MPNTRPITDLKDYDEVLKNIANGDPVFLAQNGIERCVIIDAEEYKKQRVITKLMAELAKGDEDIEKGRVYSQEEVERMLGLK